MGCMKSLLCLFAIILVSPVSFAGKLSQIWLNPVHIVGGAIIYGSERIGVRFHKKWVCRDVPEYLKTCRKSQDLSSEQLKILFHDKVEGDSVQSLSRFLDHPMLYNLAGQDYRDKARKEIMDYRGVDHQVLTCQMNLWKLRQCEVQFMEKLKAETWIDQKWNQLFGVSVAKPVRTERVGQK